MNNFEVFIRYEDYAQSLNFYIFVNLPDGSRKICTNLKTMRVEDYKDGEIIKPTFSISGMLAKPFLQAMADELHKIGIKPKDKPVLQNELTATKYHLEDMRRLVFERILR